MGGEDLNDLINVLMGYKNNCLQSRGAYFD